MDSEGCWQTTLGSASKSAISGVRTLIGTLWQVDSRLAHFFYHFYLNIPTEATNSAPLSRLSGLCESVLPHIWMGAFYYVGDWN
jgi:CHAT domain-containing protein